MHGSWVACVVDGCSAGVASVNVSLFHYRTLDRPPQLYAAVSLRGEVLDLSKASCLQYFDFDRRGLDTSQTSQCID